VFVENNKKKMKIQSKVKNFPSPPDYFYLGEESKRGVAGRYKDG